MKPRTIKTTKQVSSSEAKYRSFFQHMLDGFAYHKILLDEKGRPVDYVFLEVNRAFEELTGLNKEVLIGKRVTEAIPGIEKDPADWIGKYGKVALTGIPLRFESFSQDLGRWYSVIAYSMEKGYFAALFEDITARKQLEEELKKANAELEERVMERAQAVLIERHRLYQVLETLPAYVVLLDRDYRVPFANKFFRERFGDSHGKRCYDYLFNKNSPCDNCESYKALKTNAPHHWEWLGPDGRNYDIYDYPFVEADGSTMILEMGIDITEQKRTEAELKRHQEHLEDLVRERSADLLESEQRLKRAQEIAQLGSWELDLSQDRITWSDEAYRIFGLKPQEFGVTYEAFLEAVHPDDRQGVDDAYSGSLREGRDIYEIEHRIVRKVTGEVRYVHEKCQHIRDASGKIIRSIGMVHDITERKHAEERIKHLASFPQLNPNPVLEVSAAGKITYSNPAAIKALKRLNAHKELKLFFPADLTHILQALNAKENSEFAREVQIKGGFFTESLLAIPELNVVRIYARDRTARKLAELALEKAHEELELKVIQRTQELVTANKQLNQEIIERKAVENMMHLRAAILKLFGKTSSRSEYLEKLVKLIRSLSHCRYAGIRVLDEEENIPYESYIGFSREFWERENWLSLASDQCACVRVMKQRPEQEDRKAMTKNGSFYSDNFAHFIGSLTKKAQEKFRGTCAKCGFLSVAVIPVRYKDKVIAGIHLADKKENKLSAELVESIESLTDLIGEGIYKFTLLEKIQKTNELLERSKRLSDIGSLAATVAHELRNPLGVIRTAAYNIKRKAQNPLLDGHLANIEKKVVESDQIINNLLFYSRLKSPHLESVRIFDILKDSLSSVKNKYPKHAIVVARKIDSIKDDFIEADPLQLGELFDNILGNAYEAFIENKGKIEVFAKKDDSGNILVRLQDYGIGMDAGQLKQIFEPFYTTKARGTGLGLTVCRQIVTLHNGTISVESERHKGTTITVTLPGKRGKSG